MPSYWEQTALLSYDVVIVGSGIIGLSTAAELLEQNPLLKVCILEKGVLPTGATTRNAGFACFGSPTEIWSDIERMGEHKALQVVEDRYKGLQQLRYRLGDSTIGYEHHGGFEILTERDHPILEQIDILNTLTRNIVPSIYCRHDNRFIREFGLSSDAVRHILYLPHEAQIHSGLLVRALYRYVTERGAMVLTGCNVIAFEEHDQSCNIIAQSGGIHHTFVARRVAICTNAFAQQLLPTIDISPGRGQILMTSPVSNLALRGVFHADAGYLYFRSVTDGTQQRILLGGGRNLAFEQEATHQFALTDTIQKFLEEFLSTIILPHYQKEKDYTIEHRWSGIMGFSTTKEPIVHALSPRMAVGFACNGMGVALGTTAGAQVAELLGD